MTLPSETPSPSLFQQRLVDATPPDDFPSEVIFIDHGCPKAPYWLRVSEGQSCQIVELTDADGAVMSLPAAVQAATRAGHNPTHYVEIRKQSGASGPWLIPSGIVRHPTGH